MEYLSGKIKFVESKLDNRSAAVGEAEELPEHVEIPHGNVTAANEEVTCAACAIGDFPIGAHVIHVLFAKKQYMYSTNALLPICDWH